MLLRSSVSDDAPQRASWEPTMQVMTFYYCVDAHRRGWLRPDRVLTGAQRADLLAGLSTWVRADHDVDEILARFGPPSLTLGDPDPRQPRTLCYVGPDRHDPAVGFHLGVEPRRADGPAVLLATSFDEKPLIWTPRGDTYVTSGPSAGAAGQDAG
ncbi:MAG TPA: hypothetical protein VGX23_08215 [Actinocrinis sp.]|nr:hypothetical protein [Actinocrinis sp.]